MLYKIMKGCQKDTNSNNCFVTVSPDQTRFIVGGYFLFFSPPPPLILPKIIVPFIPTEISTFIFGRQYILGHKADVDSQPQQVQPKKYQMRFIAQYLNRKWYAINNFIALVACSSNNVFQPKFSTSKKKIQNYEFYVLPFSPCYLCLTIHLLHWVSSFVANLCMSGLAIPGIPLL